MPRANLLSENEKGQIIAYHETGMLNRAIARKISRSPRVVNNFLKNPDAYGTKKCGGPKSKLKPRDKRRILVAASNSSISCRTIKEELGLNVSPETIRRIINSSGVLVQA